MALKLKLSKSEWEALGANDATKMTQLLYAQDGDGYRLDVSDMPDYAGLQSLLSSANSEAAQRKRELANWAALGKKPEEIQELIAAQAAASERDAEAKGEWDKLKQQMNERHAAEIRTWSDRLATAQGNIDKLKRKHGDTIVDSQAMSAITSEKGVTELLSPIVKRFVKVVETEDGDFTTQVVNEKGEPRVDGKGAPLTIAALVAELRQSEVYGRAFEGTGNSGSGRKNGSGGGGNVPRPDGLPEKFNECKTPEQKAAWITHDKQVKARTAGAAAA